MSIKEERGFLIVAQDNDDVDYIMCASVLAKSIKLVMPDASVALLTDKKFESKLFDYVIEFPYPTVEHKMSNDWQVYEASPYRQTIKLEADMILPQSIDHWWNIMQKKDVCLTVGCRDFQQQPATSRYYRKSIDANGLLDVYNAITYWRVSKTAQTFFNYVKHVFNNWELYRNTLKELHSEQPDTDTVYAIAARLIGDENVYIPNAPMSLIHMKQAINKLGAEDWRKELVWELNNTSIRINTVEQLYPFHYYQKDFAEELNEHYNRAGRAIQSDS